MWIPSPSRMMPSIPWVLCCTRPKVGLVFSPTWATAPDWSPTCPRCGSVAAGNQPRRRPVEQRSAKAVEPQATHPQPTRPPFERRRRPIPRTACSPRTTAHLRAHLSRECNTPDLARTEIHTQLSQLGASFVNVEVTSPRQPCQTLGLYGNKVAIKAEKPLPHLQSPFRVHFQPT